MENSILTCFIALLIVMSHLIGLLHAADAAPANHIPLKEDRKVVSSYSSNVGCEFGGSRYDIDSQWHPILEPYGVMYCLQCTCGAVIKKGLLQQRGQVQCKRISHECPDVSDCPLTAILPPNSCCKICPQSQEDGRLSIVSPFGRLAGSANIYRVEHQGAAAASTNYKISAAGAAYTEFHALLTRIDNSTASDIIGGGYLSLTQSVLRITIQLSSGVDIDEIQLRDRADDVIYRTETFTTDEDENGKLKVCLTWRDALSNTDDMKQDRLTLVITTASHPLGQLSGQIKTVQPQVLETFSSLLVNADAAGYSGSLSMGLDTATTTLHIRGSVLTPPTIRGKHPITVQVFKERRVVHTQEITIPLASQGGVFSVSWPSLSIQELKQLARGRLTAKITFSTSSHISGHISTFHTCGGLKALVTGQDALPKYETIGVATAVLNLKPNGNLNYKIEIRDIESRISEVMIETDRTALSSDNSGKITRVAKDVTDTSNIELEGIYDKPDARSIQLLLEGKLFINIQTRLRSTSALRGQIILVPTSQEEPILMTDRRTGMASLVWCDTSECSLTCDILIPRTAVRRNGVAKFYMDYWNQQQLLATFDESNLMGATITETEVKQIGATLPTLRLVTDDSSLYGQVSVPETCFADSISGDMLPAADETDTGGRGVWADPQLDIAHKCSYDKKIYADGESWAPKDSSLACVTCSCKRNKAQCHPIVCPVVECDNPVMLPGECCPACPKPTDDTTKTCFFPGDHRQHRVGTVWHPFMHPAGYFKCAICYCKEGGSGYDCEQTGCPTLTCPSRLQEVLPGECCPSCKAAANTAPSVLRISDPSQLNMMQGDNDVYSSCTVGDKVYSNGEKFNPQIGTLGSYGNVLCTCKEGKLECSKSECDCSKKSSRKNRCCMRQCGFTEADMIRKRRRKDKNKSRDTFC